MSDRGSRLSLGILLVHAVAVQVVSYALRPSISYSLLEIGGDGLIIGIAAASFAVPPLLLAVPAGRLADRVGERVSLVLGACALIAACVVAWIGSSSLVGLVVATSLLGVGVLFSVVGEQAWVMRDATSGRLDASFGLYTLATSTGQMLGPVLLLLPGGESKPGAGFIVLACAAVAVLGFVLSFFVRPNIIVRDASASGRERMLPEAARLLRRKGVVQALVASSLVLTSLDLLLAYLPLLAQERGLAPAVLSAMLIARGFATMASRFLLGRLTVRFGRRRVLVVTCCAAAVSLSVLAVPVPVWALITASVAYGFAAGTVQPLTMSWMTLLTPRGQRGVAASMRLVGNRAGQTMLPLAAALLSSASGAAPVFLATGVSLLLAGWLSRVAPNGDQAR
ncbi:MFS transporter [Pseudoclavibacter helvolus]|uniref:MFS transporter n=1 Tax=Pseudoclavibacter helvolus TaxID=255205 RepID=UPI003C7696A5